VRAKTLKKRGKKTRRKRGKNMRIRGMMRKWRRKGTIRRE
jgi:hypothetical protein